MSIDKQVKHLINSRTVGRLEFEMWQQLSYQCWSKFPLLTSIQQVKTSTYNQFTIGDLDDFTGIHRSQ